MKEGFTIKSASPHGEELEAIERFSRRAVTEEEVYVFSVVLCDNEIDRDGERFTLPALKALAELFVGKTGIFDHSMKGRDQTARIFSTQVEKVAGQKTEAGEDYHRLTARAYMPRLPKNEELITEIETGIKKEVSVGCAMGRKSCSVCGANLSQAPCGHKNGKTYTVQGQTVRCHTLLEEPRDAYEWSFVAVPAQPLAGVTKAFAAGKEEKSMESILKSLAAREAVTLSAGEAGQLHEHLTALEKEAQCGRVYRETLQKDVVRLCVLAEPGLSGDFVGALAQKMSVEELATVKSLYEERAQKVLPLRPQLHTHEPGNPNRGHSEYKI